MKMKSKHRTSVRMLVLSAVLVAMSIVMGKYLAFGIGSVMRFSFENLPILMAGILFGPAVGAAVGAVADLLGCLMVGYAINPLVTLGAVLIGILAGLSYRLLPIRREGLRLAACVGLSHLIGSVLIKTVGLSAFYQMPLLVLMLWRGLNYLIVGAAELVLLYAILKNKSFRSLARNAGDGKERSKHERETGR